jgi:hypothetical protein
LRPAFSTLIGTETLRVTPAMEAGVADHVWGLDEIARLVALTEPRLKNDRTPEGQLICPGCDEPIGDGHDVAFREEYAVHFECDLSRRTAN